MLRRGFLQILASGVLYTLLSVSGRTKTPTNDYTFKHGVASGDPLSDGVILWTRVSGASGESLDVTWQVARDAAMQSIVATGSTQTSAARDYTVKVDALGLPSGTQLFYRFMLGAQASPIGRTRTLPTGSIDAAQFAVVSCSNYPYGYFNAYRDIAQRDDIDAVIHLGDYIYEYGMGEYATERAEELNRVPEPPTELLTLADYRQRYAQYRSDADLQALHASHPMIVVWDDHELANDAWRDGAENHGNREGVDEGSWPARRDDAIEAWFEWLPVRGEPDRGKTRIFREFRWGDLVKLIMLDTRLYGRDQQPDVSQTDGSRDSVTAVINKGKRQLLGRKQQRWLRTQLRDHDTTWQALGQQVLLGPLYTPDLEPVLDMDKPSMLPPEALQHYIATSKTNPPGLLDTWNGYPWARQKLLGDIQRYGNNTVVISGDLHTAIAGNVPLETGGDAVTAEFMTTSVTSPGFAKYLPEREPGALGAAMLQQNPDLRYIETERNGWLCMTFTHDECVGEWHLLDTITTHEYTATVDRRLAVTAGNVKAGLRDATAR